MGGCLQKCCLTESGTICCSIISILGVFYFVSVLLFSSLPGPSSNPNTCSTNFTFQTKTTQKPVAQYQQWYQHKLKQIYLLFFIWAMYRLNKINKEKENSINQKSKRSISEVHKIPEVHQDLSDNNRPTDRLLLREQE